MSPTRAVVPAAASSGRSVVLRSALLVGISLAAAGCESTTLRNREAGALGGAALGAGLGAIVGNQVGDTGAGIAIGSAAGALVGGIMGDSQDTLEERTAEQQEILRRQEAELERQRREIEDLKRQGYYNERLERYDSTGAPAGGYAPPAGTNDGSSRDEWTYPREEPQDQSDSFRR